MEERFFEKLEALYSKMDRKWDRAARHYGFECNGCLDNCCKSLFFHHTYIEKAYLLAGFEALSPSVQKDLQQRAHAYLDTVFTPDGGITEERPFCPLNIDGLCAVYSNRPMICRLHGIPHHLKTADGRVVKGGGCTEGESVFMAKSYFDFDRAPFYSGMASIEIEYRNAKGLSGKTRKTVAQMVQEA